VETDQKILRIWEIAEPVALEAGLELVDIEHRREGGGTILRLLLDRPGGVSIDDLAKISREISDLLDVHAEAVPGTYTLEVSSPGINRPLTRPAHFAAHVGKRVHVRTRTPIGERHSFRGTIESVSDDGIVVATGTERHEIPFSAIAHANYQHEFPAPGGKRGPGRRAESRPRGRSRATPE
jgi:ribosome maturation factor RimP